MKSWGTVIFLFRMGLNWKYFRDQATFNMKIKKKISWKHKCMTIIVLNKKFSNCNYLLVPLPPPLGRLWWGCPRSSIQRPLWLVFVLFFDALSGWHPRWGTRRATSVAFMLRHTTTTDLQKKGYISLQNYNRDKDIKLHQGFFFLSEHCFPVFSFIII